MKKCLICFVLSLVFISFAKVQAKSDEAKVRSIPHAFTAAWAKHDGHELAKDVDFVNVGGDWLHGRYDFELYHTRLLSAPFKQISNVKYRKGT